MPAKPKASKKADLSAGQKKLASLGLSLPLLPITAVGSLPKQPELGEMKVRVQTGFQKIEDLERKENLSTEHWIRRQERMGLDVAVDGQINRSDMISHFADRIAGFERGGLVRCYGNRYYRKPVIRARLEWKEPLIVESWRFFQRMTHTPLKAVLTGPYTLMDWSFNAYYSDRAAIVADLAAILHREITALSEAGAKIIQIDEPALASRPHEFGLVADGIKTAVEGVSAYFILHSAYADPSPVWPKMQRLPVDNFDLDAMNTAYAILPLLKNAPTKKDLTLGVIESHHHRPEKPSVVEDRIKRLLRSVPVNQLWLSPDSGLRTRTVQEADKKLETLAAAGKKFRKKFEKKRRE